jgi:hypothetical protein
MDESCAERNFCLRISSFGCRCPDRDVGLVLIVAIGCLVETYPAKANCMVLFQPRARRSRMQECVRGFEV